MAFRIQILMLVLYTNFACFSAFFSFYYLGLVSLESSETFSRLFTNYQQLNFFSTFPPCLTLLRSLSRSFSFRSYALMQYSNIRSSGKEPLMFSCSSLPWGTTFSISLHKSYRIFESECSLRVFCEMLLRRVVYLDFLTACESDRPELDSCTLVILSPCSALSTFFMRLQSHSRFLSQNRPIIFSTPSYTTRGMSLWNLQYSDNWVIFPPYSYNLYYLFRNQSWSSSTMNSRKRQAASAYSLLTGVSMRRSESMQEVVTYLGFSMYFTLMASFIMKKMLSAASYSQKMQSLYQTSFFDYLIIVIIITHEQYKYTASHTPYTQRISINKYYSY